MSARVVCDKCGARVDVPAGHTRAKIRCTTCGYYAEVPPELRGREPEDVAPPPADRRSAAPPPPDPADEPLRPGVARPVRKAGQPPPPPQAPTPTPTAHDSEIGPHLLEGTQEEDDDRPYGVPGDGTKKCPECRGSIPYAATFCTRCGTDLETGKKPKKKFQPIDRVWDYRWPFALRFQIFLGFQVVNVLVALFLAREVPPLLAFFNLVVQGGIHAFLLGSYEMLEVRRTSKGQATVTVTWRYCFVKVLPWKVPWKDSHAVAISGTNDAGMFAWAMCVYLLLCTCVVPGLVFWFIFIRPERFDILLCDVHGGTNHVLFRCTTWDEAHEVMMVIKEATGLADQSQLGRRHLDAPIVGDLVPERPAPRPRRRRDEDDDE